MTAPAPATKPALSKAEAAEFIGVSPRTVSRLLAEGKLSAYYVKGDSGQREIRISRSDAERAKAEIETPALLAVPAPAEQALAKAAPALNELGASLSASLGGALERIADALRPAEPPKPWLTLAEAAEFSGLPASWLLARARLGSHPESAADKMYADPAGCVVAVNVGTGTREFWRFNRAALAK